MAMGKLMERLKTHAGESWTAYVRHPWLVGIRDGDLSMEQFQFFLLPGSTLSGRRVSGLLYGICQIEPS